jgi:hypothetical protein
LREKDKAAFRHFLPLDLPPGEWPSNPPDTRLVVAIQDHLLEILLWTALGAPAAGMEKP